MARIAMVLAEDFEDSEFRKPYDALREAGHIVEVLGAEQGVSVTGKKGREKIKIEAAASDCDPEDYDALVIPGGVGNPDTMRGDEDAVRFVREFMESGKPTAAICHAPWMLVEADAVRGRRLTSFWSIKTDVINAGGNWVDEEVVVDGNLVTSRYPDDLPKFNEQMLELFERAPVGAGRRA